MPLNLYNCDKTCIECIKQYKSKFKLKTGQKFDIKCNGIPSESVRENLFNSLSSEHQVTAKSIIDPVEWAAETLDWHCLDPDGAIWKRKNLNEYEDWVRNNPDTSIYGHSRYHRPYQAAMLRCCSKRKVLRCGRQIGKSEVIVIIMLFHMFTKPGLTEDDGFTVITITPYQAQVELLYGRMLQLIRSSSITQNSLRRDVKAPVYQIELYNGSIAKFFTAGTKSGGNANAVRGQHGNLLCADEADLLSSEDMDSIYSIITNYPNATMIMSSTPTGKREKFFSTCNSPIFKEFYYPSQINPMWNDELETFFKGQLTEIGYQHEILANWGSEEEGVFQNSYVQAAKDSYKYGDKPYNPTWTYSIGVDWNDTKNGTSICVVGFNPVDHKFYVVDKQNVSREGWTQLSACTKIAELNRVWRPSFIYLDTGYGSTQWEVLRKYGYDATVDKTKGPRHPDSRLKDIIKQYDFGSKIETKDLFTHQPIEKDAKPFLVENSVRRFEMGEIKFSEYDKILERQLSNYIVARITTSGRPVYKAREESIGDHDLDSLMLALVAFTLEASPFGIVKYSTQISFSGQFGEKTGFDISKGNVNNIKKKKEDLKAKQMPEDRTNFLDKQPLLKEHNLPANNTNGQKQLALWSWDGFMSDKPKPQPKSLTKNLKLGRPKRKNI